MGPHSTEASNVSRISLTSHAAIIRNRISLIRFYLRRKIGGRRGPIFSLSFSLSFAVAITVETVADCELTLHSVPSERENDVPSFVSGETKVIKPRGLLDNLAYVPRYVPGLTKVRAANATETNTPLASRRTSEGKFIEFTGG